MYRVVLPIGTVFPDEGAALPAGTRRASSCSIFAPIASRARRAGFRGRNTMPHSTCSGSTVAAPTCAANRCASSSTSRAESVSGISLLICFSVHPSAEPPPIGCGVLAMMLRTIRFAESAWAARYVLTVPIRIRSRPSICPSSQAANCSWEGCCSLTTSSISSWMWVSSFRNSLSSIPHLLGLWHGARVAGGQIVDGSGQQKKRPGGRFSLSATPSDVCVLDLRRLGGLVVVPGAHAHPDGQLVYDADDR